MKLSIVMYLVMIVVPTIPLAVNACKQKIKDNVVLVGTKKVREI